jgi:DNA (cytosine-5)-methyltransferase 1
VRYLSVCSGIEAATVAWHPLGWTAAAYSEIEKFPSQVLAHHYPDVPNVGDMTKFKEWNLGPIDLLVGGTPCQSFSVAGLRKGLDDPRGNLMLTFLAIADQHRPRWLVWENVPGVLSSNGGKDFGTFLGALGELGYGAAYRILDAQFFGVAQRRRRVFVVGYLGDWRAAAAVLFERHSLSGDSAPSREKRKEVAQGARASAAISSHWDGDYPHPTLNQSAKGSGGVGFSNQEIFSQRGAYLAAQPIATHGIGEGGELARCLNACDTASGRMDVSVDTFVSQPIAFTTEQTPKFNQDQALTLTKSESKHNQCVAQPISFSGQMSEPQTNVDMTQTLQAKNPMAVAVPMTNRSDGTGTRPTVMQPIGIFQDSEFGVSHYDNAGTLRAGRIPEHQMVMQPIPFDTTQITSKANYSKPESGDPCHPLAAGAHPPAIVGAFKPGQSAQAHSIGYENEMAPTLEAGSGGNNKPAVHHGMAVRRLTPVECERLQGFPDNYTDIQPKGKATPDGPRYKALGNSMAVPVMAWIGKRIQEVEQMQCKPNR